MFGRGKTQMSENNKFIMAKGRQAGNLKAPAKKAQSMKLPEAVSGPGTKPRQRAGSLGKITVPNETLPMRSRK